MRHVGARFKVLLAASCALALLPASAQAATIDGDPLDIYLEPGGNVQVFPFGQSSYSFYPPGSQAGSAGFFINRSGGATYGPPIAAGNNDVNYTPGTSGAVTGSGTSGNPYQQVTTYGAGGDAEVTQTTTYVDGARSFKQRFEVENTSGGSLQYQAFAAADLYLEGSDSGVGFFSPGPPKFVGGLSEATGRAGGLREVAGSPWSGYQEAYYHDIWDNIFGAGLENSIVASSIDNGVGVQWDASGSATFEVEWQFGLSGLTASPPSAHRGTGSFHEVTLTATDANGDLINGGRVRYEISGANPSSGAKTTGGNGKAKVGWVGDDAGTDTLNAYLDEDGDNRQDPGEPEASANAVFVDPDTNVPPPPAVPNTPPLYLQGQPILQNGSTTLVVVVPSAGRLTAQQANAGGQKGGGKKSSASVSGAGAELFAKRNKARKGKRGKGRRGKGKRGRKRRRPSLLRRVVKRPKAAGPVRIKIRPTKLGRKVLNKRGKFGVKVRISFVAAGTKERFAFTRKVIVKKRVRGKGKRGKGRRGKRAKGKGRGNSRRR
jgi:hypothetical protein